MDIGKGSKKSVKASWDNTAKPFLKKMGHSRPLFLYFCLFNTVDSKCSIYFLPMTGFEPRISGIGSDCSTNWVTTTTLSMEFLLVELHVTQWQANWPVWPDLAKFRNLGQKFTSLWQIFDSLFLILQNAQHTLANLWHYWANVHCCKWPNIEK